MVSVFRRFSTTETQRTQRTHREKLKLGHYRATALGSVNDLANSKLIHYPTAKEAYLMARLSQMEFKYL